jgi:hypothetical protein
MKNNEILASTYEATLAISYQNNCLKLRKNAVFFWEVLMINELDPRRNGRHCIFTSLKAWPCTDGAPDGHGTNTELPLGGLELSRLGEVCTRTRTWVEIRRTMRSGRRSRSQGWSATVSATCAMVMC